MGCTMRFIWLASRMHTLLIYFHLNFIIHITGLKLKRRISICFSKLKKFLNNEKLSFWFLKLRIKMAYLRNSLILMVKSNFHYAQKMRPFNLYRLSEKTILAKKLRYAFFILGQRYDTKARKNATNTEVVSQPKTRLWIS